jgi:hypothetical protein
MYEIQREQERQQREMQRQRAEMEAEIDRQRDRMWELERKREGDVREPYWWERNRYGSPWR